MSHFRKILFLLTFCGLASACMKQPDFSQKFGPEVSNESINGAIDSAVNSIHDPAPEEIKLGQFSYKEKTQQLESLPPQMTRQEATTITQRIPDASGVQVTIVSDLVELIEGQMKPSRNEKSVHIRNTSREQNQFRTLSWDEMRTADASSKHKISFHNLVKTRIRFPVPALVKARPDCGGLSPEDCRNGIPAVSLSFDRVDWNNNVGEKTSILYVLSDSVPVFAAQLRACGETIMKYQSQGIHVTQCEETKDFTFGHD